MNPGNPLKKKGEFKYERYFKLFKGDFTKFQ